MTFWDWAHHHWFIFTFLATFVAGPLTFFALFCVVAVIEMFVKLLTPQRKPNENLPENLSAARALASTDETDHPRH